MKDEIQLQDVSFEFFPSRRVIQDINLTIERGTIVGIIGPNGSGKSTLARLLNGNLHPTSGTVLVDGLSPYLEPLQVKRLVALIQADAENQIASPTVYDEVSFGLNVLGMKESKIDEIVMSTLENFRLLEYRDTHPFYLSVGEQFRVLVAGAIVRQPNYLILDEVLSMLDSPTRQNFLALLVELRNSLRLGIVLITHRMEDLLHANRVIAMENGRIAAETGISEMLRHTENADNWNLQLPLAYEVSALLSDPQRTLIQKNLRSPEQDKGTNIP